MLDEIFNERYKNLNAEQRKAVDTIDGPVMVVAGPGTGKTTILTLRIAQILRQTDTPAHGILAITYTDAGVKAIREKLREVIGNRAYDIAIHTFHSFASAMISEYPDHFIVTNDFRQMSDVEQESLVRTILTQPAFAKLRPVGKPDAYISGIVRAFSDAKKDAMTPDMVRDHVKKEIERIRTDESNISSRGATKGTLKADALDEIEKLEKTTLFADVYEQYESEKRTLKLRDYDDLIIELLATLHTDKLFLRLLQERFLYILVDEHQDTNDAQNLIVTLIAEFFDTPNIFIVGDEKQAIYRFQGASVENFLRLRKRWPTMQVISLNTNYRSHQDILDASFAMIENNYEDDEHADLRVKLISGNRSHTKPLDIVVGENMGAIEQHLAKELKSIIVKEPQASVAIITRYNRELERVLRLLENNGIPVSSERSVDIFHHPLGVAFFDLIRFIVDPSRIDALANTVASGLWGLSFEKSISAIRAIRSNQTDEFNTILVNLSTIRNDMLKDGAVGGVIQTAELSGLTALVSRNPGFVHVWKGIVTLAESLARDGHVNNPVELMKAMLAYEQSAEMKTVKVSVGAPDLPIKAMTAHGSKGLEFDYVFIPYANEESWIGRSRGSSFSLPAKNASGHDVRDTRRLFYVAITRARKHAVILYALSESDGKQLTALRFIQELNPESIATTTLSEEAESIQSVKKKVSGTAEYAELMVHQAKDVLLKTGLSVTALNHFIDCPSKFLYESILKLPQAPSASAEKGTAMHQAISNIWTLKSPSEEEIAQTIITTITEHIDSSLLSPIDKEMLKLELTTNAPIVAKALFAHFTPKGTVISERWVEVPFDGVYEKNTITIPLHGKLDAMIETGELLDIFDYKTRRSMTVAAIKGETKSDEGNYFRQLIFYRLLVQNNQFWKGKKISTSLIFVSPDDKGRCPIVTVDVEDADMKKVREEIQGLIDSVWSGKIAEMYCDDATCKYCGYRRLL